jgi:hypothetical protein
MDRFFIVLFFTVCFCLKSSAQGDHLAIGFGPSMVYVDNNSGVYKEFRFRVRPAITLAISKQLSENLALRGTIGAQIFDSGEHDFPYSKKIINWGNRDQAFEFKGSGYFADFLPVFTTNPNATGMLMSTLQFYAGLGFGVMMVNRDQKTLKDGVIEDGIFVEGDIVTSHETSFTPYVPLKIGISTNLSGDWDFALEYALLATTNSELDGNNIKHNRINPDMTSQILFTVKWYFGPAW